jgi:hypothetical protein
LTLILLTPQAIEQLCLVNQELDERPGTTLRFDRQVPLQHGKLRMCTLRSAHFQKD